MSDRNMPYIVITPNDLGSRQAHVVSMKHFFKEGAIVTAASLVFTNLPRYD